MGVSFLFFKKVSIRVRTFCGGVAYVGEGSFYRLGLKKVIPLGIDLLLFLSHSTAGF